MSLTSGSRLSIYEVVRPLGAGAMGEVYLARDTRLEREVAIKLLPEGLAKDADHLARFEREAKLLATISHPNIAGIFAVENEGDTNFIVLELVPGMTLGERIAAGPLPVPEVLGLARQIAEGLEAAHEAGVIHRDLKPDNIRVTPDDTVKLLDFGLAKAMPAAGSESGRSRTDSLNLTQTGMLLGTPYYMSPEQVRSRPVDRRTDIWAFGCVLFEALTGTRAFPGDTLAEVAAAVLEREPDWDALPRQLPRRARELLEACLTKDPKERLRDMGDARRELQAALSGKRRAAAVAATQGSRLPWLITGLALAGLLASLVLRGDRPSAREVAAARQTRFQVPLPEGTELMSIALAGDGSAMALALRESASNESFLAVRRLDETGLKRLPNTENAALPFWSPDGSAIGFVSDEKLKALTLSTNQVREVCDCRNPRGAPVWSFKGHILFNETWDGPLLRVSASGGEPEPATRLDAENLEKSHRYPSFLPDGESFVFSVLHSAPAGGGEFPQPPELYLSRPDGSRVRLGPSDSGATYVAGCLVWRQGSRLLARQFDIGAAAFEARAFPVAEGVEPGRAAASAAGVLALQDGASETPGWRLVWHDLEGNELEQIGEPEYYSEPRPSPIAGRLATQIWEPELRQGDIWILDERGGRVPLTRGENAISPVWSPDGKRIAYAGADRRRRVIFWRLADGTGERHEVAEGVCVHDWSADGKWLSFCARPSVANRWVRFQPMEDDGEPLDLREDGVYHARFSPDGRWIAYSSGAADQYVVYVRSFPALKDRVAVSGGYGIYPVWMPDGKAILFAARDGAAMLVRVEERNGVLIPSKPKKLFDSRVRVWNTAFEVSNDGKRILVNTMPEPNRTPVTVITGWRPPNRP